MAWYLIKHRHNFIFITVAFIDMVVHLFVYWVQFSSFLVC
jgi:hypothetical protein